MEGVGMGEAKRRGTYEERKAQAIERNERVSNARHAEWLKRNPGEGRPPVHSGRMAGRRGGMSMALAAMLAMGAGASPALEDEP
jgi:hypothetical protein